MVAKMASGDSEEATRRGDRGDRADERRFSCIDASIRIGTAIEAAEFLYGKIEIR